MTLITEVFPVVPASLPKLSAWRLDLPSGDRATTGGKLAYRLRGAMGGHWVWSSFRILGDVDVAPEKMAEFLKALWSDQKETFKGLRQISRDAGWAPSPQAQADFVSRGLLADADREIRALLGQKRQEIGDALVERVYETRSWVVRGAPAVSLSVFSRLVYKHDVNEFAKRLKKSEDLCGLFVADKTSSLKGELKEIVGTVAESRAWLLATTQREEMQDLIRKAPDDELVVGVLGPRRDNAIAPTTYHYIASALRIVLRSKDFGKFRINRQSAQRALRIEPRRRSELIKEITALVKKRKLVGGAFNSSMDGFFVNGKDVAFDARVRFGGNRVADHDGKTLLRNLQQHGVYRRNRRFENGQPIKVGVVNALRSGGAGRFLDELSRELERIGFGCEVVGEERARSIGRADLEQAVHALETRADILVGVLPDETGEDEDEWGAYQDFKSLTVCNGTPSQVVYASTLQKQFAMGNIVLGVVGKTGNIPYVRAVPLPYCDLVVGIDIARRKKDKLSGSMNATAITRVYLSDGEFLKYVIHDAPIEGETIPPNVIQRLFPVEKFKGKRAVVHRDGYYRGDEKDTLRQWGQEIGAEFLLVEILKTGTPRIYSSENGVVAQPPKASTFCLSDTEAFLVSSLPPFKEATPQPLRIRADPPFTVKPAVNSVLSLTVLHYGSLREPRLPVSTHYSDRIAYLALKGIKPRNLEGDVPYWL